MDSLVSTILGGKYEIQAEIGRGGMGVVHRGFDVMLRRPVAIKVLPLEYTYLTATPIPTGATAATVTPTATPTWSPMPSATTILTPTATRVTATPTRTPALPTNTPVPPTDTPPPPTNTTIPDLLTARRRS